MITIAETEPFQKKANKLLSSEEKEELINYLAENPASGDLIQGTGGIKNSDGQLELKAKVVEYELFIITIVK